MKRCPHCNSIYTNDALTFCLQDGVKLVNADSAFAETLTNPEISQPQNEKINNSSSKATTIIASAALFISILGFLIGIKFFEWVKGLLPNRPTLLEAFIALLNILLSAFVLMDMKFFRPIEYADNDTPASRSFKQLLYGWRRLWIVWILLYTCLAVNWFGLLNNNDYKAWKGAVELGADVFNIINGFFFYYLFFVLDQPSVATEEEPKRAKEFHHNIYIALSLGIIVLIASRLTKLPYFPGAQGILGESLIGAYTAVGMVFFIGRLDSHYLRLRRVVLAPLYLYGIIQLYWGHGNVGTPDPEQVTIFSLALILKLVIFLFLSEWIKDGRFYQYIVTAEKGLRQ